MADDPTFRESERARIAFLDYAALGNSRSLTKLVAMYKSRQAQDRVGTATKPRIENGDAVPTVRLATLAHWSARFMWSVRLRQQAEEAERTIVEKLASDRLRHIDEMVTITDRIYSRLEAMLTWPLEEREIIEALPDGTPTVTIIHPAHWRNGDIPRLFEAFHKGRFYALGLGSANEPVDVGAIVDGLGVDMTYAQRAEMIRFLERMEREGWGR